MAKAALQLLVILLAGTLFAFQFAPELLGRTAARVVSAFNAERSCPQVVALSEARQ